MTSGNATKYTVMLTPRTLDALKTAADVNQESRTDVVNRAVRLYLLISRLANSGLTIIARDAEGCRTENRTTMTNKPTGWRVHRDGPFDAEAFYLALDAKRRTLRISWREVCRQAGIQGPSTLSRMSLDGKLPHLQNTCRLMVWLGDTDLKPFLTDGP